jgi:predicted ATPase
MITHLTVENFKCLQKVSVELGPFTVLIGANDSGKSSVLDAIQILARTVYELINESLTPEDAQQPGSFAELVFRREAQRNIQLSIEGTSGSLSFQYSIEIGADPVVPVVKTEELLIDKIRFNEFAPVTVGSAQSGLNYAIVQNKEAAQRILPIVPGFASTTKYRFEPRALRRVAPLKSKSRLTRSGDNLPEALDAILTGPDRTAIQRLESALHAAVPTLSGIALRTVPADTGKIGKALEFILAGTQPPITIPAANASEGALLLTAFLTLAYGDTPEILLIEEPENGLHPTRLETVIDLLRKISTGAVGNRPRQVIMTTHSPLLLNYIKPEEVRIVRRDPERGAEVTPMTAVPNLDRLLAEFAVGELWYLLTEEGLLKGQQP